MSRTRNLVVRSLLFMFLWLLPVANTVSSQDEHAKFWKLVQTIEDILAGKNVVQATMTVAKKARLIFGARDQNLSDVVAGNITTCSLADTAFHGIAILAQTNPSEDMGLIVLKTVKADTTRVRFHTVVFMKDSTGEYKIINWHTGDCDR